MEKKRYSVLTYIFGGYEQVREVLVKDPEAEYILVTDDKTLHSATWTIVYAANLEGLSIFEKCYHVRFHLFDYCNTDICFRLDGSIKIKDSLAPIIDRFEDMKADIMVMLNPVFHHLHEDYAHWTKYRGYPRQNAKKALKYLHEHGYDETYRGYYQACLCIERNNENTRLIGEKTYEILKELGGDKGIDRFDQPIWSFVLNKYHEGLKVMTVSEYLISMSKYLQWCRHNSNVRMPFKRTIEYYLFNEKVNPEVFDFVEGNDYSRKDVDNLIATILESDSMYDGYVRLKKKVKKYKNLTKIFGLIAGLLIMFFIYLLY